MGRLAKKNVLLIIPKDYYNEEEFDAVKEILEKEEARILVASNKYKNAIGMKSGSTMPDVMVVDAMEGITGDSYVTAGKGTRQILGVFHGVILIGGTGARLYMWKDELVRLLITDRYKNGFVVAATSTAIPCLAKAQLIKNMEVSAPNDKKTLQELEKDNITVAEEDFTSIERVLTLRGKDAVQPFMESFITEVEKTQLK
jgi:putative intracellular protease/amidase